MSCRELIGCLSNVDIRNKFSQLNNQKLINNSVRMSSGMYQHNISSAAVITETQCANKPSWHQASDRVVAGQPTAYVPRRRMGIRPGGLGTGGKSAQGVDVKHNSYARFLALKRGKCI